MNHTSRFLEYVTIHIKHRRQPDTNILETILWKGIDIQTKLTNALIKLVCHPSDTLRTAVLSFLDAIVSKSSHDFSLTDRAPDLLPQLFGRLNPHQIPLNESTIVFHSHAISLLENFFADSAKKYFPSNVMDPIFQLFDQYLPILIAAPVCPNDGHQYFSLLSRMMLFNGIIKSYGSYLRHEQIQPFSGEIGNTILNGLSFLLGFVSTNEARRNLDFSHKNPMTVERWLKGFKHLIALASEGWQFTDVDFLTVVLFLNHRPDSLELCFYSEDQFGLKMKKSLVPYWKFDAKALWTLFTPTQPHHATPLLAAFRKFMGDQDCVTFMKHIWNEWFPSFRNAVDPSKLPFTMEFIPLHTELVELLHHHLSTIEPSRIAWNRVWTDRVRRELDEKYRAFYTHTRDYAVHLSLHPFALDGDQNGGILNFLHGSYLREYGNSLVEPYREEVRREMDASALSSSSPPLILTSELVCCLTDDEIVNIVDRIVALLGSDTLIHEDTFLRIFEFQKRQLGNLNLPDVFRNAERSPAQCLHAFETLLSLPVGLFDQAPLNHLLSTPPSSLQPIPGEWDEVDLKSIGIVKRIINQNRLSDIYDSKKLNMVVLKVVLRTLPQALDHATRHHQPQFEGLITPFVDVLAHYIIQQRDFEDQKIEGRRNFFNQIRSFGRWESTGRLDLFIDFCKLCDQRVIARYLNRTGFFSHFVIALFNLDFDTNNPFFRIILDSKAFHDLDIEEQKTIRRTVPNYLEEGWQDVLEFIFVQGSDVNVFDIPNITKPMLQFVGSNLIRWYRLDEIH
ncbi:hypothetical protein BLNAU_11572 [Blattamonas nauphoetae]|uniref:Uncharacterized protein n=1 Tax=Blattamonas nauphoetae TaxID=2049346 RepID=A0ABQ9XLZ7_9EUKA|nr:hypothetical protein BLNAU_11572 [Blattamonas nauphoetae]